MSTDERWVRPAADRRIREPGTNALIPDAGRKVVWGSYWDRLVANGDAVIVDPDAQGALDLAGAKPAAKGA